MRFEFLVAKRLFFQQKKTGKKTGPAVRIAITGIAVGLAVMIIAVSVVIGFKRVVRDKVIGVDSHIQITSYYSNQSYEMSPVLATDSMVRVLDAIPGVRHAQRMYMKPGMVKTEDDFQAVVFKGADENFDKKFLSDCLIDGKFPDYSKPSNQVLISEYFAKRLRLKTGDSFLVYFIRDESVSARKFRISGIFNTHFAAYDNTFMLIDARHIRKLNDWADNQAAGIEVFFKSMDNFSDVEGHIYDKMGEMANKSGEVYYMRNLFELNPDLFGWLDLLNMNVMLILVLMICVSGFNIISGLLILILEKTNFIGIMKALGSTNRKIRRIFLMYSTFIIAKGLFWGDVIGLSICFLQDKLHLLKLDPSTYYVDFVPMDINWLYILALNIGTIVISMFVVMIPSALVSRIHPAKAIKFE